MIELAGTEGKLEAFIQLVHPYGIIELARTGVIAMPRGIGAIDRQSIRVGAALPTVDDSELPPG